MGSALSVLGSAEPSREALVSPLGPQAVPVEQFGGLAPISRQGGQGRVHRPTRAPTQFGTLPVVVKLYRRAPPATTADTLGAMVAWSRSLPEPERELIHELAAWPLAIVSAGSNPVGIAMQDVTDRFTVPFVMPSGRRAQVLLSLEHLLGPDAYLRLRGLDIILDTATRARVAERICRALGCLHRHAIVVSDIAPSNLLVSFRRRQPKVCFIDCDSMVFRGQQALAPVETGDWNMPAAWMEMARTRASDAYKLGLIILRLFVRSHDARTLPPHLRYVPVELRDLLYRALEQNAANRPPAGEWQRALGQLILADGLNERYPGPPARTATGPTAPSARPTADPARFRPAARPRSRTPARPPVLPPTADWLRRTVVVMWILAGTLVLFVLLSHLFASAIPTQDGASATPARSASPYGYGGAPGPSLGGAQLP